MTRPVDIDELVRRAVAGAPPLTDEQRSALARLLPPPTGRRAARETRTAA